MDGQLRLLSGRGNDKSILLLVGSAMGCEYVLMVM